MGESGSLGMEFFEDFLGKLVFIFFGFLYKLVALGVVS